VTSLLVATQYPAPFSKQLKFKTGEFKPEF
jgi:hypothetical protein